MSVNTNENLGFGEALEALKKGKAIARKGWNGKGMCIYLNKGSFDGSLLGFEGLPEPTFPHGSTIEGVDLGLFGLGDNGTVCRLPNLNMKAASGSTVTGWLASQTDLLAQDWCIVEN